MSETKSPSGKFKIERSAEGLRIFIQSKKIEDLFKSIARENRHDWILGSLAFQVWYNDATEKFGKQISDMFASLASASIRGKSTKEEELSVPTFRGSGIVQGNNAIGIALLMARGISEGKEFVIPGMFSFETTRKIALAYNKTMKYLIEEAPKACTFTFEIFETKKANSKEESTILEFDNR